MVFILFFPLMLFQHNTFMWHSVKSRNNQKSMQGLGFIVLSVVCEKLKWWRRGEGNRAAVPKFFPGSLGSILSLDQTDAGVRTGALLAISSPQVWEEKVWRNVEADSTCSILFQNIIKERKRGERGIKNGLKYNVLLWNWTSWSTGVSLRFLLKCSESGKPKAVLQKNLRKSSTENWVKEFYKSPWEHWGGEARDKGWGTPIPLRRSLTGREIKCLNAWWQSTSRGGDQCGHCVSSAVSL